MHLTLLWIVLILALKTVRFAGKTFSNRLFDYSKKEKKMLLSETNQLESALLLAQTTERVLSDKMCQNHSSRGQIFCNFDYVTIPRGSSTGIFMHT